MRGASMPPVYREANDEESHVAAVNPYESLELVSREADQTSRIIGGLTDQEWEHDSNCAGWKVANVAAHVVRNGESVLFAALSGAFGAPADVEPVHFGAAARPRDAEILALGRQSMAELQKAETGAFVALVSRMTPEQLDRPARHPSGIKTVGWFATVRLVELAFHHWDIRRSLGDTAPLDAGLAGYALAFMLDPQRPLPSVRDKSLAERRILIRASGGPSWLLTAAPGMLKVSGGDGPADFTVEADSGWLALAMYGRVRISDPAFHTSGASDAAGYFASAFGAPI